MESRVTIEVFAIGTELVLGRIQDTNSYWMAQRIAELGGQVRRMTTLSDDFEDIIHALQDSLRRGTDLVITSGGLGPTPDDLTVAAVCRVTERASEVHEPTLDDYVRRRNLAGREQISPGLLKMATVPEGAVVYPNPAGWAPCTVVPAGRSRIVILPGPPKEMEAVFQLHVAGLIAAETSHKTAALRVAVNMFESEVSPLLQEVMEKNPNTYLKAYVAMKEAFEQGLPVDVVATGADEAAAQQSLQRAVTQFAELVTARGKKMEYYDSE